MSDQIIIVCAAMRRGERIIAGARHYDSIMRQQINASEGISFWLGCEQGFIDQRGNFYTREQAHEIARNNDQIKYRCGGDRERLFSENLY